MSTLAECEVTFKEAATLFTSKKLDRQSEVSRYKCRCGNRIRPGDVEVGGLKYPDWWICPRCNSGCINTTRAYILYITRNRGPYSTAVEEELDSAESLSEMFAIYKKYLKVGEVQ